MPPLYFEDFSTGQTFGSSALQVTADDITRFAAEFDPQPFHLDDLAAQASLLRGLAASGWHTAALTMKLLVSSDFTPAGGIVGTGFEELRWLKPVRPDDELHIESEIVDVRPSASNGTIGVVKVRTKTRNQNGEVVQLSVGTIVVPRRQASTLSG